MAVNWFGGTSRIYPKYNAPAPLYKDNPTVTVAYTVGLDTECNTVMKVAGTTLTMSPEAVRQLIRLLEATLPEDTENVWPDDSDLV